MSSELRTRIVNRFTGLLDVLVIVGVLILEHVSALTDNPPIPNLDTHAGGGWLTVRASASLVLIILILLKQKGLWRGYIITLRRVLPLVLFMIVAIASISWSVNRPATVYQLTLLLLSTLAGGYFALRYRLDGSINLLTWAAASITVLSLLIVFLTPFGVDHNIHYVGSWKGLFWHRNHAGSLMAFFSSVFLFRILFANKLSLIKRSVFGGLYLLALLHVIGSRSAAGVFIFLFLNTITFLGWLWMKLKNRLGKWHYYAFGGFLGLALIVFVTNLDFFLGLLGRSSSLTGRVPLWQDLLWNFFPQRALFGYGFGAFWMQEEFPELLRARHGWAYPIIFADNGFLDILLNLGIVGIIPFLLILIQGVINSVRKILNTKSWMWIFVFVNLLYVIIGNLSYSLLLEVEGFVWMILIMMVFLVSEPDPDAGRTAAVEGSGA